MDSILNFTLIFILFKIFIFFGFVVAFLWTITTFSKNKIGDILEQISILFSVLLVLLAFIIQILLVLTCLFKLV